MLYTYREILSNSHFLSFCHKIALKKENDQNSLFYFEIFNFNFFKFETLSSKSHLLTINPKSTLVNSMVKIHFHPLIKLILIILFIESYFVTKT